MSCKRNDDALNKYLAGYSTFPNSPARKFGTYAKTSSHWLPRTKFGSKKTIDQMKFGTSAIVNKLPLDVKDKIWQAVEPSGSSKINVEISKKSKQFFIQKFLNHFFLHNKWNKSVAERYAIVYLLLSLQFCFLRLGELTFVYLLNLIGFYKRLLKKHEWRKLRPK